MDTIDTCFLYRTYRVGKHHMLEVAANVSQDGSIAMVYDHTGSGKLGVAASHLAIIRTGL